MAKKKGKNAQLSWCWYCDRTFEDAKVLLQHQKAKHFRCPHCPRRLNTAGGLSVHIDQVHKLGTDKIENALPGRESFDVEIYGMEGIPAADLAAWKKRTAEESGVTQQEPRAKKARYSKLPLTVAEVQRQLAAHRALMSGLPLPGPQGMNYGVPPPGFGGMPIPMTIPIQMPPPPPGMMGFPGPPPPMGFIPPPFTGMPGLPPPPLGFAPPPGFVLPPGMPLPPPGMFPPPPGMMGFPPPPPGFPLPLPPHLLPQQQQQQQQAPLSPGPETPKGPAALRGMESADRGARSDEKEMMPSSQVVLKAGTLLVYGDNDVSPEEKRAKLIQYRTMASEEVSGSVEEVEADGSRKRARATDLMS